MDLGNEFLGEFQQLLEEENIKIRRVNPEKQDHNMLAPLNAMCRFVRNSFLKEMLFYDK